LLPPLVASAFSWHQNSTCVAGPGPHAAWHVLKVVRQGSVWPEWFALHALAAVLRQAWSCAGALGAHSFRAVGMQASYVSWAVRMQACAVASHAAMQADRVSAEALQATSVATNRAMLAKPRTARA
jgi:hypothetical protein